MENAAELDFGDEQWAQEMLTKLVDPNFSLSEALENLRPLLYGSLEEQERALERLVALVLKLPTDFLAQDQIHLLLKFLLDRLDSSGLAATRVLDAVRHLLVENNNTSKEESILAWRSLYQEGNVQAWSVNQRLVLYEILEWLCTVQKSATLPLGSEFVLSFVKSIGGERDPRCLTVVFRLFVTVAKEWSLGPFVEEMFETIACYYPIQFKPKGDQSITKESLSYQCESCLVAQPGFAPFCLLMIEEKLTEVGLDMSIRADVCTFMVRAVSTFPAFSIPPHVEALLSALRAVTFDPNDKYGESAAPAANAMRAMVERISGLESRHLDAAIDHTMENIEPFVLQAEMGLSLRAFDLLETLCVPSSSSSDAMEIAAGDSMESKAEPRKSVRNVVSRSLSWALTLVQGDTTSTAANKADVCKDGLQALVQWITVARRIGCSDVVISIESTLLAAIDAVRNLVGKEARITAYTTAGLMVEMRGSESEGEEGDAYGELLKRGLYSAEIDDEEREAFLSFVSSHSIARWNLHQSIISQSMSLGEETTEQFALNRVHVACASVHSDESWKRLRERIWQEMEVVSEEGARILLGFARSERGKTLGVDRIAIEYKQFVEERLPRSSLIRMSSCIDIWQQWGSIVSQSCHSRVVADSLTLLEDENEEKKWMRSALASLYVLMIVQAKDDNSLYRLISLVVGGKVDSTLELRSILYFAQVNRFGDDSMGALSISHMVGSDSDEQLRLRITAAKAHLVVGRGRPGLEETKELLSLLSSHPSPSSLLDELLDYSSDVFEIEMNGLNASPLWRQRIAYQLVPLFESAVKEAKTREWRITLLSSLRLVVKLCDDASLLTPLLDTLISSLIDISSSGGIPSQSTLFLVQSLDQLVQRTDEGKMTKEKVAGIVHALSLLIEQPQTDAAIVFAAITCIRSLLSTAKPVTCQPSITRVVRALARATGHSKRAIRTCAADARNRW
ncbi:hypothetical protein PFISCL1PPCAC_1915, partial [Pristionchus fissidentatus]